MSKVGRPNQYYKQVKPYLKRIDEWLNSGASEKQIADALNVAYSSWNNYKNQFPELKELCDKPRVCLLLDLRGALIKRALGHTVETKKTYIKKDNDGNEYRYTEITKKELPPDTNAIFGAMNRYDPDYIKDKAYYELKKDDLELRKELAKEKLWNDVEDDDYEEV